MEDEDESGDDISFAKRNWIIFVIQAPINPLSGCRHVPVKQHLHDGCALRGLPVVIGQRSATADAVSAASEVAVGERYLTVISMPAEHP